MKTKGSGKQDFDANAFAFVKTKGSGKQGWHADAFALVHNKGNGKQDFDANAFALVNSFNDEAKAKRKKFAAPDYRTIAEGVLQHFPLRQVSEHVPRPLPYAWYRPMPKQAPLSGFQNWHNEGWLHERIASEAVRTQSELSDHIASMESEFVPTAPLPCQPSMCRLCIVSIRLRTENWQCC